MNGSTIEVIDIVNSLRRGTNDSTNISIRNYYSTAFHIFFIGRFCVDDNNTEQNATVAVGRKLNKSQSILSFSKINSTTVTI
jgi:hypothetical protein